MPPIRQVLAFDTVDFGTRVSIGQIYRSALAVQGVEWAELTWLNAIAPVDNTDPDQGDTTPQIGAGVWQHSTDTTIADPGNRHYRRNDAANPTQFAFSTTDDDLRDVSAELMALKVGDHLIYRPVEDVGSWMSFLVVAAPINAGHPLWVQINVTRLDQAETITAPKVNDKVVFSVIRYLPTPDSLGGVHDIETPELLIPRITPPLTIHPPVTVSNRVLTANVVTLTLTSDPPNEMVVGDTVDVSGVVGVHEVQRVTPGGTISGGTFTMTLLGVTTNPIQWNANAAAIKGVIDLAIPGNTITVAGGPVNSAFFTLTFTGYGDVAQVTIASSLTGTGPTLTPSTTTPGIDASVFNGRYQITALGTLPSTLSYVKTHPDVATVSSPGTVTHVDPWRPESEDDYPDLDEEERTHDGLWVIAEGGLIGT